MIEKIRKIDKNKKVKIAIVGKYIKLEDSYISVIESIKHAGFVNDVETEIKLIDSEKITKDTVDEMLKAICVVSANDCVVAMAEHIAGSEEAFVQMMNDKANELGMSDTCFKNFTGFLFVAKLSQMAVAR